MAVKRSKEKIKLLTIDVQTYVGPGRRVLDYYDLYDLHYEDRDWNPKSKEQIEAFLRDIPEDAEVVVNYNVTVEGAKDYFYIVRTGIALVPNRKEK